MHVEELRPELWRWTAPHPAWTEDQGGPAGWDREVSSYSIVPRDRSLPVVLIDPLVPAETTDRERFWRALDKDAAGRAVHVLVQNRFHSRSASKVAQRYGGATILHAPASARFDADLPALQRFGDGSELPGGIVAHEVGGLHPGEFALHHAGHGALFFADAVLGAPGGGVRLPPASWSPDPKAHARLLSPRVRELAGLGADILALTHGEPVRAGGVAALRALAETS